MAKKFLAGLEANTILVTGSAKAQNWTSHAANYAAGGTQTLTSADSSVVRLTGTGATTVNLPSSITLSAGHTFKIINRSDDDATVKNGAGADIHVLAAGEFAIFVLMTVSGTGGTWDVQNLDNKVDGTIRITVDTDEPATAEDGDLWVDPDDDSPPLAVTQILQAVYPVGSIYISTVSTNPATLFGFGTWSAFATGRTLVGIDAAQTEFDTVEETGGAKTHTLTTSEMPAHTHPVSVDGGTGTYPGGTATSYSFGNGTHLGYTGLATATTTGGGGAHNNLQPYIVTHMWKRTG